MRDKIDSGGTVAYSVDRTLTTSYTLAYSPYGKDPNTSAVWGTTAIDNVKIGYRYHSGLGQFAAHIPRANLTISSVAPVVV